MSQSKKISHVYNPDNQTRQELLDNFVVRLSVFDKLFRAINDSRMDTAEQHFLIQGQRGTGKTTLLLKLAYEIESDPSLAEWLVPVRLNEEQYNIFSLCRLWESVAEQLAERPGFEDLPDIFAKSFEEEDYPEHCYKILEKRLQRENKKLLLLIDNIVDVLKKIGEKECRQLRDILHTTTEIRIIAASARTLEHFFRHDKPFFEFFKIIYLEGLSGKETEALLLKLAENYQQPAVREIIEKHPGRVETLRRLTGGIPRTIILLFEIFVDDSANVFEDLELILDRITPLYKHRMDDLSGQQQAIMDAIAMNWDAIATGDIARKVRMESKAVAAQLNILEQNNLIHAIPADRKNKLYLISERFFNIWYLMRYGRKKSREQVRFLVRFLEEWCSPEELAERINRHISLAHESALHAKGAYYMCEALAQCAPSGELQHDLIRSTREFLGKASPELAESLPPSDREIFHHAITLAEEKNDLAAAIRKLVEIRRQDEKVWNVLGAFYWHFAKNPEKAEEYFRLAVEKGHADAMNNLALLYEQERKDLDTAEKYYLMAVEKGDADAMFNLANLYWQERQDLEMAEKYYQMAVEKGNAGAMNNLATLYWQERQDLEMAEKYYRMAVEKGLAEAMVNLAILYEEKRKDLEMAEKYYHMAVEKGNAGAMNNLAYLYWEERQDLEMAEKYYRMAMEKGHADGMYNLATLYWQERQDLEMAEKYYRMAVEKGLAEAMVKLAILYWQERNDLDTAEKYYRMAAEKGEADAMNGLAWLYFTRNTSKEEALQLARQSVTLSSNVHNTYSLAVCLLWHDRYGESVQTFRQFLEFEPFDRFESNITLYLVFLLAKRQHHLLLELFNDEQYRLRERCKPVYYALMQRMRAEFPKEYKKMGEELRQTVEEILAEADKMAQKYG
jgi:TPR repeat protein